MQKMWDTKVKRVIGCIGPVTVKGKNMKNYNITVS